MNIEGCDYINFNRIISFVFPLYLLKSQAWYANSVDHYGSINDNTISSFTMSDYLLTFSGNFSISEVIFQYNISLKHLLYIVCDKSIYNKLYPIVGDKLRTFETFERKRYIDDLFIKNDYPRIPLRLDYISKGDYFDTVTIKTIYNILLNSGKKKKKLKS